MPHKAQSFSGVFLKIREQKPVLKTARLSLELFGPNHLTPKYISWLNDPVVCKFNRHGSGYTIEKAQNYQEHLKNSANTLVFSMLHEGRHIGNISINDIDWQKQSGEISILIGEKQAWGKGFGTEAVKRLAEFSFQDLGLKRVWVGFTINNPGMRKIAESTGFSRFQILKNGFVKPPQEPVDVEEWELLKQ